MATNKFSNYLKSEGVANKKKSKFTSYIETNAPESIQKEESFTDKAIGAISYPSRKTEELLTGGKGFEEVAKKAGFSDDPSHADVEYGTEIGKMPEQARGMLEATPASMVAESARFVTDPLNIIGTGAITKTARAGAKGLKAGIRKAAGTETIRRVARAGGNIQLGDAGKLGHILIEHDLNKYMNRPRKLYEKISGTNVIPDEVLAGDRFDFITVDRQGGLVSKLKKEYMNELGKLKRHGGSLNTEAVHQQLIENLSKHKGIDYSVTGATAPVIKEIKETFIKRGLKDFFKKGKLNIVEAQKLKEEVGKYLGSSEFKAVSDNKSIRAEKAMLVDLYRSVKESVEDMASGLDMKGIDGRDYIKSTNQRMSDLITLADNVKIAAGAELAAPTAIERGLSGIGGAGIGAGIAAGTGLNPIMGAGAGMAGGMMFAGGAKRLAETAIGGLARPKVASLKAMADYGIPEMARKGAASLPAVRAIGREPQSIADSITDMRFPRDSEWFMNNQDQVLLKIAQNKPEMLPQAEELFRSQSHNIKEIMPAFVEMAPDLFEIDKYGRFDNIIMKPQMRIMARKDMLKDDALTNTQKVKMINKLNKTGVLDEY